MAAGRRITPGKDPLQVALVPLRLLFLVFLGEGARVAATVAFAPDVGFLVVAHSEQPCIVDGIVGLRNKDTRKPCREETYGP
jgi:hypothetical protein